MAKKQKQQRQPVQRLEKERTSVGDVINSDIFAQLKQKQKELLEQQTKEEEQKRVAELERKKREQKEREKNKTFEDLLGESNLSWKDFK